MHFSSIAYPQYKYENKKKIDKEIVNLYNYKNRPPFSPKIFFDTRKNGDESRVSLSGKYQFALSLAPSDGPQRLFFDVPWFRLSVFVRLTSAFALLRHVSLPPENHHVQA